MLGVRYQMCASVARVYTDRTAYVNGMAGGSGVRVLTIESATCQTGS